MLFGAILLLERCNIDVAVGDRAVIALEHDGTGGGFPADHARGGGALHLDVLVEYLAIEFHDQEPGIGGLLAGGIKLGSEKIDLVLLPLTGLLAGGESTVSKRNFGFET